MRKRREQGLGKEECVVFLFSERKGERERIPSWGVSPLAIGVEELRGKDTPLSSTGGGKEKGGSR